MFAAMFAALRIIFCIGLPTLIWIAFPVTMYLINYNQYEHFTRYINKRDFVSVSIAENLKPGHAFFIKCAWYLLKYSPLFVLGCATLLYLTS